MTQITYPILKDAFAPESDGNGPLGGVNTVFEQLTREAPWVDYTLQEWQPLQILAFNERLRQRRNQIAAVDQRASQLDIDEAETLEDVAPLIFSSVTYKSYPESFVANGQWDLMLRWLSSLSTYPLTEIDTAGTLDLDDLLDRVRAAGHRVLSSSGTSGKPSLFPESQLDDDRVGEIVARLHGWMLDLNPAERRINLFYTGGAGGNMGGRPVLDALEHAYTRPDGRYNFFEEAIKTGDLARVAQLNKALADGTASPSDIEARRREQALEEERNQEAVDRFAELLIAHSGEPFVLGPHVWRIYQLVEALRLRKWTSEFHPDSRIWITGGVKNNTLPGDYLDQIKAFFRLPVRSTYGQSEFKANCVECDHGRKHIPPYILLVLLDPSGSEVLNAGATSGTAEGLFAGFDFTTDGRWGGLATNDWVEVNFDPCPCGMNSPAVVSVSRIDALKRNDDKVNCGGRIEMYVRGAD